MTHGGGERSRQGLTTRAGRRLVRLLLVAAAVTGLMGFGLSQASAASAARAPTATASLTGPAAANPQGFPFVWYIGCSQIPPSQVGYGTVCTVAGSPWTATGILQSNTQAVWCPDSFNQIDAWTVAGEGRRTDAATPLGKLTNSGWVAGRLITITNLSSGRHVYTPAVDCADTNIPPIPKPGG